MTKPDRTTELKKKLKHPEYVNFAIAQIATLLTEGLSQRLMYSYERSEEKQQGSTSQGE